MQTDATDLRAEEKDASKQLKHDRKQIDELTAVLAANERALLIVLQGSRCRSSADAGSSAQGYRSGPN